MRSTLIRGLAGTAVLAAALVAMLAVPAAVAAPSSTTVTVIRIKVVNGRPVGGIKRPTVKKGTVVRIVVVANKGEELHLHGYDIERTMRPPKPAVMQFTAKLRGRFELEMHEPDAVLMQLTVK